MIITNHSKNSNIPNFNKSNHIRSNITKTTYPSGDIFYGVLTKTHNLKQDFGELHTSDNKVIIGEWDLDQLNGVGIITESSGKQTLSIFSKGLKNGIGEIKIKGRIYRGEFKGNKRTGLGMFVDNQIEVRKGYFVDGEHQGYGEVEIKSTGNLYRGNFEKGKPSGVGLEETQFDVYIGNFQDGRKNGLGKLEEKDGFKYLGQFVMGQKQGFGVDASLKGDYYAGDFFHNLRHGVGRLKGSKFTYTGQFKDQEYSGFGRLQTDKFMYIGDWRSSTEHGLGYLKEFNTGYSYFGYWDSGKKHGIGYETKDSEDYKGEFFNDLRHGRAFINVSQQGIKVANFIQGSYVGQSNSTFLDLKKEFSQLNLKDFFENSKQKLIAIDHAIDQKRKFVELQCQFNSYDFERQSQEMNVKLKDVLNRLDNLKIAFDRKNDIFKQELYIYDLKKSQLIQNTRQSGDKMEDTFENIENYVEGFNNKTKKLTEFLSPASFKNAKQLPKAMNGDIYSASNYTFDEFGRKEINGSIIPSKVNNLND